MAGSPVEVLVALLLGIHRELRPGPFQLHGLRRGRRGIRNLGLPHRLTVHPVQPVAINLRVQQGLQVIVHVGTSVGDADTHRRLLLRGRLAQLHVELASHRRLDGLILPLAQVTRPHSRVLIFQGEGGVLQSQRHRPLLREEPWQEHARHDHGAGQAEHKHSNDTGLRVHAEHATTTRSHTVSL